MAKLTKAERAVIEQLLTHGVFTGTKTDDMKASALAARDAYQKPEGQRRINGWFNQVFGRVPMSFQDNWVWLMGPNQLSSDEITVLLATLKAVINTPAAQNVEADRVIEAHPIITSVQTVTNGLSDKQVGKLIDELFVQRFQLLVPDNLVDPKSSATNQVVNEYWDVSVDFVEIAQLLVQAMQTSLTTASEPISMQQQVNAYLLKHRYLDKNEGGLWEALLQQKKQISAVWQPLQRFYLEVGDNYAALLDADRRQLSSRQYFVALAVARSLKSGLPEDLLGT
ncbi:hypothetical protein FEZ51_00170 [Pediococcus stilesii]|uniref:Uncharacterized protein n=1 Tax=Pediococcus stilesii TaxID=331679 RepID=A0A5R9BY23_9LACO|nr:hypothetical protein [Pediococcus stilesii]TLQ05634.1 hypothetical protein FEZ51_00170 [Pediococcus stilesii]